MHIKGIEMRMNIELSDELAETVRMLAKKRNTSISDVVRRAISLDNFFEEELSEGNTVILKNKNTDKMREVVLR
jgi:predicted transcriptional regulator